MSAAAKRFSIVSKQFEFLLKVGAVVLGALYVCGLLITNIQLMSLGVADFAALRSRNIMIGFVFLIYVALLMLVLIPISLALAICYRTLKDRHTTFSKKIFRIAMTLLVALVVAFFSASLAGSVMGYFFPAGRPWMSILSPDVWGWGPMRDDMVKVLRQLHEIYVRPKTKVAVLMIVAGAALPLYSLAELIWQRFSRSFNSLLKNTQAEPPAPDSLQSLSARLEQFRGWYSRLMSYICLLFTLPLLLFDYADAVYPNLLYNLGGGQPRLARMYVEKKDASSYRLFDQQPSADSDKEHVVVTNPMVLWYQDDSFVYLSPMPAAPGPTRVVAIDSGTVYAISYLHGHLKIGPGGQILAVHLSE
jgi:hypothetical protein